MSNSENIAFSVDTEKILKIISDQIYQSPLALLRENTQNAYDAVLMRKAASDDTYKPEIKISISNEKVSISDNGIGMSREVVEQNFWKAGSSGKNNEEARKAGVVGTFGIGALANFGVAESLTVVTESLETGERIKTYAKRSELDINAKCIQLEVLEPSGDIGTTVSASLGKTRIDEIKAKTYITQFVETLPFPVFFNDGLVSQKDLSHKVPTISASYNERFDQHKFDHRFTADVILQFSKNGQVRLHISNMNFNGKSLLGEMVLLSNGGVLQTFRSGFGLSAATVSSHYAFGGAVDLQNLKPTAGREALNTESLQFLQSIFPPIERFVSEEFAKLQECNSSNQFLNWVVAHQRFDLCDLVTLNIEPGSELELGEVKRISANKVMNTYTGRDQSIIRSFASDENRLLVLSTNQPRRRVQQTFLQKYCKTQAIPDSPSVLSVKPTEDLTIEEQSLIFRLDYILDGDYFLKPDVRMGKISHGVDILAEKEGETTVITLDPESGSVKVILNMYDDGFSAFTSLVKDFVRNSLFTKISSFVPSSTRQGAEAFLKAIQKKREIFEIDEDDTDELSAVWDDYLEGKIPFSEVTKTARTAPRKTTQTVDASVSARAIDEIPDVVENEAALAKANMVAPVVANEASPSITRLDTETKAKILLIDPGQEAIRGYRAFLALTDKAQKEYGDFFLHPHKTSCVWGGQKILFIFMHHSDRYGLYYDLQTQMPIETDAGGGSFVTSTLVLKNKTFIPIPEQILNSFVPDSLEKKRFDIRYDIIKSDFD